MEFKFHVEGGDFMSAGTAASQVKKALRQINIAPAIIKRVAVALYEAEINIVAHAHRGNIKVFIGPQQVNIRLDDEGPGIENIEQAMRKGFSTASQQVRDMGFGAGMGLPNIKENSDFFTIRSEVGKGTELEITINTTKFEKN